MGDRSSIGTKGNTITLENNEVTRKGSEYSSEVNKKILVNHNQITITEDTHPITNQNNSKIGVNNII